MVGEFGEFVAFAVIAAAKLGLDRLQLLVEVIFALGLFHLALHAATDLALHLQHAKFALHEREHHFEPLHRIVFAQQGLLFRDARRQIGRDGISQLAGILDIAELRAGILRQLLRKLGIFTELFDHRAHHALDLGARRDDRLGHLDLGQNHLAIIGGLCRQRRKLGAAMPFDQHAHGAIGQLEQLQDRGNHAGIIKVIAVRIVTAGIELGEEKDLLVARHSCFQRRDRFLAPDEQRHDHAGKHDNVAQGEQGIVCHVLINSIRPAAGREDGGFCWK